MPARRLRRIVHATDFSTASSPAFAKAVELARSPGARVLGRHVMTPPSPFPGPAPAASWIELGARARRAADRGLAQPVARAARAGIRARGRRVPGAPAETIARQ